MWASCLALAERLSGLGPVLLPALLDAAVKGVAVLILTALVALAMRRASAATRHLVWFLGVLSLLVLPLLSAALPGWYILPRWAERTPLLAAPPAAPVVAPAPALIPPPPDTQLLTSYTPPAPAVAPLPATPAVIVPATPTSPRFHLTWQAWVVLAWLAGSTLLLGHMALGYLSLMWLQHRSSRIAGGDWLILLRRLCAQLRIRRPVHLLSSPRRTMPMTWGLWRTRLLLPADADTWTAEQRHAVLLHELAHAKRYDCLTQLLTQIACALNWFNPLVWLARRQMQAERERACDDLVLNAGTKASAYAEQLLHIASKLPAMRFSAAAIAMARKSRLEGRLLAVLDTSRNRRPLAIRAAVVLSFVLGFSVLVLAALRADETPGNPALQAVSRWAASRGWTAQAVTSTTLESRWGGGWRDLPFSLDKTEEADALACVALARKTRSSVNGKTEFSDAATRAALEELLKRRPDYFYAEFLLALWHRDYGDAQQAVRLLDAAYQHAPAIIVQRFELADGSPLADTPIQSFALECNRVQNGYLDPSLQLLYPDLRTDVDGCVYLPVYSTVYRTNEAAFPAGYAVAFPRLGWFETSRKVGLLPAATVRPRPGDFAPAVSASDRPTTTASLPGNNTVELLAVGSYPDPANVWWLPDGSPSARQYQTGPPGVSPWPAEGGRRFVFRFAKPLEPESHLQFRFSAPAGSVSHYATVRNDDLGKPYVLFTSFPTRPRSVSIRVGQASGPWKTLAHYDPRTHRATGNLPEGFAFKELDPGDSDLAEIIVSRPAAELQLRMFAIDSDNHEHSTSLTGFGRTETTVEDSFHFKRLPLSRIRVFRLEAREYQWVQFDNIALEPSPPGPATTQAADGPEEAVRRTFERVASGPIDDVPEAQRSRLRYEREALAREGIQVRVIESRQQGDAALVIAEVRRSRPSGRKPPIEIVAIPVVRSEGAWTVRNGDMFQAMDQWEEMTGKKSPLRLDFSALRTWADPRLAELRQGLAAQVAAEAATQPGRVLHFVQIVVGQDSMTYEGQLVTWEQLPALLEQVPDRRNTVLSVGVDPKRMQTLLVNEERELRARVGDLAHRFGFAYASYVGEQPLAAKGGPPAPATVPASQPAADEAAGLNEDQRLVLEWTNRQFSSYFDGRTFAGWSDKERANLEARSIDALKGPRSREYYQAIGTLAALKSAKGLPALREIAFDRRDKNNRDRWMAIRALGLMGDRASIPELIHLVYHGNINTHWWAQISLVRLTGQNFGSDWQAWGRWWNETGGQPPYDPQIIRWWSGQPKDEDLARSLAESDRRFLESVRTGRPTNAPASQPSTSTGASRNAEHMGVPADPATAARPATQRGARLDFRVAAQIGDGPAANMLSPTLAAQYVRDLETHGPQGGPERIRGFDWFEVGTEDVANWITGTHQNRRYTLLMSIDPYVMLAEEDGRRAWGLRRVYLSDDAMGHTAIGLDFDDAGAERFGTLTTANLNRPLAVLIGGKVLAIGVIRARMTGSAMIARANGFDPDTAREIVAILAQGMPPTTAPAGGE